MDTDSRALKEDIADILAPSSDTHTISKTRPSRKSQVRHPESHSPTGERLTAVRIKLDEYISSILTTIPVDRQSEFVTPETFCSAESEKRPVARKASSPLLSKRVKSQKTLMTKPLEKVTYEPMQTLNGNMKQKCSVEIWLPHVYAHEDDGHSSTRTLSRSSTAIDRVTPLRPSRSRLWSMDNTRATIVPDAKPDKPAHSDSGIRTAKTNVHATSEHSKQARSRRLSKDTLISTASGLSITSRTALPDVDLASHSQRMKNGSESNTSTTVNNPTRRSAKTRAHQRPLRAKRQFKHLHHPSERTTQNGTQSARPLIHPTVAFRIILGNTLPLRSAGDYNILDPKLLACCSSNDKPATSSVSPPSHAVPKIEHDPKSTPKPTPPLPSVTEKIADDPARSTHNRIPSRLIIHSNHVATVSSSPNLPLSLTNHTDYHSKPPFPLPPIHPRSAERRQQEVVPYRLQTMQRPHSTWTPTTDATTKKHSVHLKYSKGRNASCNYLTPK